MSNWTQAKDENGFDAGPMKQHFTAPNGIKYVAEAVNLGVSHPHYSINFYPEESGDYDATGTGHAKAVFDWMHEATAQLFKHHGAKRVSFIGVDGSESREKLYKALTQRAVRKNPEIKAYRQFREALGNWRYTIAHHSLFDGLHGAAKDLAGSSGKVEQLAREGWEKGSGRPGEAMSGKFTTSFGQKYVTKVHPSAPGVHNFSFRTAAEVEDPYGITGTGEAKEVFGKVISAIQSHLKEHTPARLSFAASEEEPSRIKLYDFLAKRVQRIHPEYTGVVERKHTGHYYHLVHESHLSEFLRTQEGAKQLARSRNFLHDLAEDYHAKHKEAFGLDLPPTGGVLPFDEDLSRRTAAAFERSLHKPAHPFVQKAYGQFKKELLAQYQHLVKAGVKIEPWTAPGQPYANSKEMQADVLANKRVKVFLGGDMPKNHPLAEEAVPGMTYNDLLRGVHDVMAHAKDGHQFGAKGELQAWGEHARLFSPLARHALTAETHGQNSWVNFGPHSHLPVTERPFAEQKATVLPKSATPRFQLAREEWRGLGVTAADWTAPQGTSIGADVVPQDPGKLWASPHFLQQGMDHPLVAARKGLEWLQDIHEMHQPHEIAIPTGNTGAPDDYKAHRFILKVAKAFAKRNPGYQAIEQPSERKILLRKKIEGVLPWVEGFSGFDTPAARYYSRLADRGPRQAEFSFAQQPGELEGGAATKITGAGHAKEVFGKVIEQVRSALHEGKHNVISFSADGREPSRQKLYEWLAARVQKLHPDFRGFVEHPAADEVDLGIASNYFLVHKDHVEEFKRHPHHEDIRPAQLSGEKDETGWSQKGTGFYHRFEAPNGVTYYLDATKELPDSAEPHEVSFVAIPPNGDATVGVTNTGHAKFVFDRITQKLKELHEKHGVKAVTFSATGTHPSRSQVYKILAKRFKNSVPGLKATVAQRYPSSPSYFAVGEPAAVDRYNKLEGLHPASITQLARWDEGVQWERRKPDDENGLVHRFVAPNGEKYHIYADNMKLPTPGRHFNVIFEKLGKGSAHGITGTGHSKAVFDRVIGALHSLIHEHGAGSVKFAAMADEPSRIKLYRYLSGQASKLHPEFLGAEHVTAPEYADPELPEPVAFTIAHKDAHPKIMAIMKHRGYAPKQLAREWPLPDPIYSTDSYTRTQFRPKGSGTRYYVEARHDRDELGGLTEVDFMDHKNRFHTTHEAGPGEAKEVFSRVIGFIHHLVKNEERRGLYFSASGDEKSRLKLYDSLSRKVKHLHPEFVAHKIVQEGDAGEADTHHYFLGTPEVLKGAKEKMKDNGWPPIAEDHWINKEPVQLSAVSDQLSQQGNERKRLLLRLLLEAKLRPLSIGSGYALHPAGMESGNYAEVAHNGEPEAVDYVGHYFGMLAGQHSYDLHAFHEGEGNHTLTVFDSPLPTDQLYEALAPAITLPMVRVIPKQGTNRVALVNLPQDSEILGNSRASNVQQFTGQFATLRHRSSPGSSASARETHRDAVRQYESSAA